MIRKFSELTLSEQNHFNSLVEFMKETCNEDIENKLKVIQKFRLDPNDPVVFDFLIDMYAPSSSFLPQEEVVTAKAYCESSKKPDFSIPVSEEFTAVVREPSLSTVAMVRQIEKRKKREMTYANSKDLIIVQNRLLHAISHLTLNERRLILFLSPVVRKQIEKNPENRVFYVHVQDFVNEYGIKSKRYYAELERIADSIVKKAFFFWYKTQNGKAKKGVSWVSECDYIENEGKLKIKLDDTVIEMLTVFDKATGNFWTQYQKEWVINLGTYGIIMLEMILSSVENKGYYTIEHLREKFDCMETYKKFSDFKLYVIDKAVNEIHMYTPINIRYEQHKTGRTIIGLTFSYIDKSIKNISTQDKEKNNDKTKERNPFVNFKMTQKQLALFASKIKKASGQDVDEIIFELSNVHLQFKHVDFLKVLDFVPSDWYSDQEIKEHRTIQQITQAKAEEKLVAKAEKDKRKKQLKQDFEKITACAEIFVKANLDKVNKTGIEQVYLQQKDYVGIIKLWEHHLLNEDIRKHFSLVDEILAM